jgi:hypothetical protein
MLSSLVDVRSKCCLDFRLTKHFNERKAALKMLPSTQPADILLFDRGYFSNQLVTSLLGHKLHFVMRLKCDAFKDAKRFFNSSSNMQPVMCSDVECRLIKYYIDGKKYMCLTSLHRDVTYIRSLYKERWRVEEHYKRLKSHLHLDHVVSHTLHTLFQDMELRVLLDTISLLHTPPKGPNSTVYALHTIFQSTDKAIVPVFVLYVQVTVLPLHTHTREDVT